MVHEVIDCEITRRSVFRYEWIAVQCERGFRGRQDSAEVTVLFVEHLLHLLANHGMSECPIAGRHAPIVSMSWIVLEVQKLIERLAKTGTWPCEPVGQIGKTRNAAFERRFIADVQDHSCRDGGRGILPVAFLRAVLAGAHDHVGDILCIADITRREQPDLAKRIES